MYVWTRRKAQCYRTLLNYTASILPIQELIKTLCLGSDITGSASAIIFDYLKLQESK